MPTQHSLKIGNKLPFNQDSFDVAIAAHVFVEVRSLKEMRQISSEVYRVLKPGGSFIVIANNSRAIGNDYLSFSYPVPTEELVSGRKIHPVQSKKVKKLCN